MNEIKSVVHLKDSCGKFDLINDRYAVYYDGVVYDEMSWLYPNDIPSFIFDYMDQMLKGTKDNDKRI